MKKGLVIVESPTKARTLQKYLGKDFDIKASVGHIKDLPKKRLGVDIDAGFTPEYEIIRGKGKVLKELKTAASRVEDIYLAPDPDREGEAIAWHIAEELGRNGKGSRRFYRVLFHELTERAIRDAITSPVQLDRNKFESQQARRILDRLVGYEISPLLWEKVRRGLSAGRVQSVAVRIVCDREREIQAFVSEEYWTVEAGLEGPAPPSFTAKVIALDGEKLNIRDEKQALGVTEDLKKAQFSVRQVETRERRKQPAPPFITSTLQQEAARRLRFPARKTMMIAQKLYEGIDLGEAGPVGLITYMRTDSTRIAEEAANEARDLIRDRFGKAYVPRVSPNFKRGKLTQDAHEAIRPTSVSRTPEAMSPYLDKDALALYGLIWKRFVASQMAPALLDQTRVDVEAGRYTLRVTGSVMRFPGFTLLYLETQDETRNGAQEGAEQRELPALSEGQALRLIEVVPKQHFTQPPPRYTEASLIKTLEEKGIGRPSTYATILSTIRNKEYVRLDQRHFVPTELGLLVTDLLVEHFPEILDASFTAAMEKRLDEVMEGETSWIETLRKFYDPFRQHLNLARGKMRSVKASGVATDIKCEKCGSPMVIKYGKTGEFLACSAYPQCKNTKDFSRGDRGEIRIQEKDVETEERCPQCGKTMVRKRGKFGEFLACSGYPECRHTRPVSIGVPCPRPDCSGMLVKRRSRGGKEFCGCSLYPGCDFATWDQPVAGSCPQCNAKALVLKNDQREGKILACPTKGCGFRKKLENP